MFRDPQKILADSATAALQVQQEGIGNAYEVADSAGNVLHAVDRLGNTRPGAGFWVPQQIRPTIINTTFQAGHGYTVSSAGSSNVNDTTDFILGSQAAQMTTLGTSTAATLKKTGQTAMNLTGLMPCVWVKFDGPDSALSDISLYLGDTTFTNFWTFTWAVAARPYACDGEWVRLIFPWAPSTTTGAPNRASVTDVQLRLKDTGTPITAHFNGVAFVPEQSTFPNGVVSFTFDDGLSSQYTAAKQKLDQYLMPASAYVIVGNLFDYTQATAYMTIAQLHGLEQYSGWEIGAHAFSGALHNASYLGQTQGVIEADLNSLKTWLKANSFTRGMDNFAYPLGNYDLTVLNSVRKFFGSARGQLNIQQEALPVPDPYRLRVLLVANTTTTAAIQTAVDTAYTNKEWLILVFHDIVTTATTSTQYSIANFGTVVDYVNTKGIPVRTVGDVLRTRL